MGDETLKFNLLDGIDDMDTMAYGHGSSESDMSEIFHYSAESEFDEFLRVDADNVLATTFQDEEHTQ